MDTVAPIPTLTRVSGSPVRAVAKPPGALTVRQVGHAVAFVLANIVLAIAMRAAPMVGSLHAVVCLVGGVITALVTRQMGRVAVVVAYIAGCEVLWRMTEAGIFYEFGKYAVIAVLAVALLRLRPRRNRSLTLLYIGLLLPSIALTFLTLEFDMARQLIGFYMSGPVAIALCVLFFSNTRLTTMQVRTTFVALIGPVAGIGALSLVSTLSTSQIEFGNGSNYITSGGFGPNQVSSVLGLALMFLLLLSVQRTLTLRLRVACVVLAIVFGALAGMTFARGGVALAVAGTCAAMLVLFRGSPRTRIVVVSVGLSIFLVGKYVVEPRLDAITQGKFSERYTSGKTTGRDLYAQSELQMFQENPVLGVGPGIGWYLRDYTSLGGVASHTEYTRMLAEHGLLGIISLGCLVMLGARALKQNTEVIAKARSTSLVTWFGLFLLIYGTRIAAPAFAFGLAFALPPLTKKPMPARKELPPAAA